MDVNQEVKEIGVKGPKMTIYSIFGDRCQCVWKDEEGVHADDFHISELRPWVERKGVLWKPARRAWRNTIYQG